MTLIIKQTDGTFTTIEDVLIANISDEFISYRLKNETFDTAGNPIFGNLISMINIQSITVQREDK